MPSIDILYTQIFQKSKRCALESRATGKLEMKRWGLYLHLDMYD